MVILALTACLRGPDSDDKDKADPDAGPTTPGGECDASCDALATTVRFARLTHLQWENTVQDLLFLEEPTGLSEAFLGDTLSEGFDNDANKLEVGSELWLDYQRAAELLSEQVRSSTDRYNAVVPQDLRTGDGPPAFATHVEGEGPEVTASTGAVSGDAYNLWSAGTLEFDLDLPQDGSYTLRVRVWADQAGGELAQASMGIDGQDLLTVDVNAVSEGGAETFAIQFEGTAGLHQAHVAFLNDYYVDGEDRNLYVDWMEVEGAGLAMGPSQAGEAERDAWIASFGQRAHRRPLTDEEISLYTALFELGPELVSSGDDFADGVQVVISALLQSPYFLYRVEESEQVAQDKTIPLSEWELASKLSYALWNTMPDEALFETAREGRLSSDEGLRTEAQRLLDDDRSRAMFADLHHQLLRLDNYENIVKDSDLFPEFTETTAASMRAEAAAFVDDVVTHDGSIFDLFTTNRTFVNDDLAPIYGLSGPYGDALVSVELEPSERAGLLTLSGFLALEADAYISSPIRRGVFINHNVWCVELPPPPNVVPPLPPNGGQMTTRELVDSHTGQGTCGEGCHSTMINPPGFALESYDALGRYRTTEYGMPIDSSGTYSLSGGQATWNDPIQFAAIVGDAVETHRCWNEHLLEYLHGRTDQTSDDGLLDYLANQSRDQDKPIREIVLDLVLAKSFRSRLPEVQ
jgi:hypothetical protein